MGCLSFLHAASNQSPLELAISAADYFDAQSDVFKTTSSSPPRRPQRDRQPSPNTVVAAPCAKNIIPKNNAAEATNITSPKAVRISNSATANSNTRIKRSFIKIPHATASTMNLSISNSLQTLFHWMVTAPARLKKPGVQRPQLHRPQTVRSSTYWPDVCFVVAPRQAIVVCPLLLQNRRGYCGSVINETKLSPTIQPNSRGE